MSFAFKTGAARLPMMQAMTISPSSAGYPFHAGATPSAPSTHPAGAWPPGPPAGLTGWGLLGRMSRDLLGTLAAWQREFGDVVHLRIWPEHEIIVADPQLARELLVTHHHALVRWERGTRVFAQLQGHSVFIAEGEAWRAKRHALQPAFSPKAVQAFVPTIAATAEQAFKGWPISDERWRIESALTSLTMDVIMRMLFSSEIGQDARRAEQAVRDECITTFVAGRAGAAQPSRHPDYQSGRLDAARAHHVHGVVFTRWFPEIWRLMHSDRQGKVLLDFGKRPCSTIFPMVWTPPARDHAATSRRSQSSSTPGSSSGRGSRA